MRLKLSLLLVFIITYSWSQSGSTKTFTGNGTFPVPAGVTSGRGEAWGGGGSGGGASGAPLLLGRGSAGGGGGAYASAPLLVTPGTTLNVVVASQTSGTSGAGTAGGNSTITGFETSILAAGGSGGGANNAGGSPIGGIGGSVAASAGSTKLAGANGGNGNSWNLLGLLLSSGAGGAGANSGGAGGTAVSGLILSNAPGNAGSPPGGAGSGAINSALGASQIGGAGAAGRVIISYSCANFSLTSTAATNFCASTGTTSTVTLTGTAASLPIGNYVVTYNRSSPVATALTANLTVSTAGTGTFTAVGLTTGSSTITVTKLASETCSSNITANNTATITISPATVGGTVAGGTTINAGNTSGLLTLSGHTGSVVKWQSSVSPFSVWTDIANTNTTYTSGVLTETTQFRAVVQSGSCTVVNSAATTVTVEALPTIALQSQAQGICSFNNGTTLQTTLGYTATTGTPVTYSIVWNSSPANSFTAITDAALPTSPIILYFPAATAAGIYTGTLTVKNASGSSSLGSVFNVFIDRSPSITSTGAIAWVTSSNNSQNTTLAYSSVENPTRYSIDWNSAANAALLTDQLSTLFAFSPGGGVINNIVIPANVPAGTYTGIMYISNETSCNHHQDVSITVSAPVAPTIALASSAGERCPDSNTTTLEYSGTTGSPITYSIVWNASPANTFAAVTDAPLPASPIIIAIPAGTDSGTYTGTLTVKNADGIESLGSVFAFNVKQGALIISNYIITPVSTTTSIQYTTLAYSGIIANPTQYALIWDQPAMQNRPLEPFTFSPAGGVIDNIKIPANVPPGTYTGLMTFFNGDCFGEQNVSIVINSQAPTIALASSAAERCSDSNVAQTTTLEYSGTTGLPITYSIVWNASPANTFVAVTDAALPASPISIAIPAGTDYGTYTGTLTVKNADGTVSNPGSIFTVSLGSVTAITTNGIIATVASRSSLQNTSLTYFLNFGSVSDVPTKYSIDWDQTANNALLTDQPTTSFDVMSGTSIPNIVIPANVPAGTYTGVMYVSNESTCSQSINVSITISTAPTIVLSPLAEDICTDINGIDGETILEYSETTGDPVTYSIVWDSSPANSFETVIDQEFPTPVFSIIVPAGTVAGTYTGTLTVKNADGIESLGSVFALNVKQTASIISNDIITPVSTSTSIQYTTLAYSGTIGNPTECFLAWDQPTVIHNQFFEPSTFSSSGGVIDIIISANVPPGTYTGIMTFFNGDCYGAHNVSIVINSQAPTIALASSAPNICFTEGAYTLGHSALSYEGTTGNPTTYSIVWDPTSLNDFEDVTDAALPASPITIITPYTNSGTYTGTLTVKDANGVSSTGSVFNVEIGFISGIILDGPIQSVCFSANAQLTTLAYSPSSSATSYYIDWDQAANDAGLQNQLSTPHNFSTGDAINTIQVSAKAKAGTYSGRLYLVDGSCSSSRAVSITINAQPGIRLVTPLDINVCSNDAPETADLIYTAVFENPTTYSIVWYSSPANSFVAVTDAVLPASPIQISIPAGADPGIYTGRITVKNANGCESQGTNFNVTINATPTTPIIGEIKPPTTENPKGSIAFSGLPPGTWGLVQLSGGIQDFVTGGNTESIVLGVFPPGDYAFRVVNLATNCSSGYTETVTVPNAVSARPASKDNVQEEVAGNTISIGVLNKVINVETPNQIIDKVYIFDVSGNLIYEKDKVSDAKLVITDLRSGNQVLVVKVILNNGHSETRKVIF